MIAASRMIWRLRKSVKARLKDGISSPETERLHNNLLAIHAVVMDQEEEIQLLQQQLSARAKSVPIDASDDNVVRLKVQTRITPSSSDGGDAA